MIGEKELPEGWELVSFTSVLDISGGTQPAKKEFIYEPKEGYIRLLQIRDFGKKPVPTFIPDTGKLRLCDKSDIMIARYGASIGRILTGMEGAINVAIAKVIIPDGIEKKFVFWYLKSPIFQNLIVSFQRTAQNGFNKKDLAKIDFPLIPLPEQKRIVAKLDTVFGHLDALKEKLAGIPKMIAEFRQSVLTQAVTGKLTEEWRVGKDLGEWKIERIQDITSKVGSGSTPRGGQAAYQKTGIPLIRSMNIHFGGIKYDGLAFIDEKQAQKLKNVIVQSDDVLLNITGASIGRVCLAPKELNGARVNQHVSIIRPNENVSSNYINIYMSSSLVQDFINSENYGVTRQALTKGQLLDLKLNVPPFQEQVEIVKGVEALFAKADAIEARYTTLKGMIDDLPQAVLAKAFRGDLV